MMAMGLAARRVHCDFRKSKLRTRTLDVGIKQHNTHCASTALYVENGPRMLPRSPWLRKYNTVRECVQCTACMHCNAHCVLIRTMFVTALKIEPITRILGEYSLEPYFRASNRVIGILVSPLVKTSYADWYASNEQFRESH